MGECNDFDVAVQDLTPDPDYSLQMYPLFSFATEEFMEKRQTWTTDWVAPVFYIGIGVYRGHDACFMI